MVAINTADAVTPVTYLGAAYRHLGEIKNHMESRCEVPHPGHHGIGAPEFIGLVFDLHGDLTSTAPTTKGEFRVAPATMLMVAAAQAGESFSPAIQNMARGAVAQR